MLAALLFVCLYTALSPPGALQNKRSLPEFLAYYYFDHQNVNKHQQRRSTAPTVLVSSAAQAAEVDTPSDSLEQISRADIEERFGVHTLETTENSRDYLITIDDTTDLVLRSSAELKSDFARLESLEKSMEANLDASYGVRLGHAGEFAAISPSPSWTAQQLRVRSANLAELYALRSALERSLPAQFTRAGSTNAVKVYFLLDWNNCGARADWGFDASRKPAIVVEPNPSTFLRYTVLQEALIHEFGHNSAYRLGFDMDNAGGWRLIKRLGWKTTFNPRSDGEGFAIVARNSNLYKYKSNGVWIRCNACGQSLKADGSIAAPHACQAERRNTEEIRELALVKPISTYCPNPMEIYAEGLAYFRRGEQYRKLLLQESPELYRLVKEQDQLELNRTYGKGMFIRALDGRLTADRTDIQKQIAAFETKLEVISTRM
jgi:hypothetical protein